MLISKTGFDVTNLLDICISGLEMVELVKRSWINDIHFKLILTDFSMPEMDGVEATMIVRQFFNARGVPRRQQPFIVGVTGHEDENFTRMGINAGMD